MKGIERRCLRFGERKRKCCSLLYMDREGLKVNRQGARLIDVNVG